MTADNTKPHPLDTEKIDISDPAEIQIWCIVLRCNEQQLRAAVKAVGTLGAKIREYLGK